MVKLEINKTLLPLKLTLFFFSAAAYAVQPYLTIHMKDIGISDIDIALIYTILPFCAFIAPPIVGFFGDKFGNYIRVLQLCIVGCGIFHSLLLIVPVNYNIIQYPDTTVHLEGSELQLQWTDCQSTDIIPSLRNKTKTQLSLTNCSSTCTKVDVCSLLSPYCTEPLDKPGSMLLTSFIPTVLHTQRNAANFTLGFKMDPCQFGLQSQFFNLPENCGIDCIAETNIVSYCEIVEGEGRMTTNAIYFLLRMLATMCLASCFIMLDAQTIQMCRVEEEAGKTGAYGRQIMYKTLAQAIISPLVGILMDKITELTGSTNYIAPFVICDILLVGTIICTCFIGKDIGLPKDSDTMKGVKLIFSNPSCVIFLFMILACGTMYGFVETFLFVFLKEDLNAPIYLLGLTITAGALVSIPFLYYSHYIVDKCGMVNIIIVALLMYGVRYVGYSYITCAWYAFPFETLEVFTLYLLRVSQAKYIKVYAPPGTLATLTGLSGGAHFGFGKGIGGLFGGVLKDQLKSTALAFRIFGVVAFGFGTAYAIFHGLIGRKIDARVKVEMDKAADLAKAIPLLEREKRKESIFIES